MDTFDIYLYTTGIAFIILGIIANEDFMKDFIFIGIGLTFSPFVYYVLFSHLVH